MTNPRILYVTRPKLCMLYTTKPHMLYITKPGGALLPSSGCDGSQGPPPAAAPPPIIQCIRQTKNNNNNNKDTVKNTNEIIKCIKDNKMLQKQNGIVQRNGQRKEHIATHKQNDEVQ